jgi:regulator of protease activity HflC (stomatin/prohibitin superfamily)
MKDLFSKPYTYVVLVAIAGFLALFYAIWHWMVERVEVEPGHYLVRVHKWGQPLPEGNIIAPDDDHKGILLEPLKEGRHYLNPFVWSYRIEPIIEVPAGKCLVVTRLFGREIPPERLSRGDFLAKGALDDSEADGAEKGIMAEVLRPGRYRLNPYAFKWEEHDAIEIGANEVGVRTLKVGKDPRLLKYLDAGLVTIPATAEVGWPAISALVAHQDRSPYVVPDGYRGVQARPRSTGTYYINPFVEEIVPVRIQQHQVAFANISFPTTDGFTINPEVVVTYQVLPEKAPSLLVLLTNQGVLSQEDVTDAQKQKNQILQKVILPQVRGYVRIQGSKFPARAFLAQKEEEKAADTMGNARERLQRDLLAKVAPSCLATGVQISSITVGQATDVHKLASTASDKELGELAKTISDRELARVERDRNLESIKEAETQKELKAAKALKEQQSKVGDARRELEVAKTKAQERKEVKEKELETLLENAQIKLDAAREEAKAVLAKATAEAQVIEKQNEAEVSGLRRAVEGFTTADTYAQYQVLTKLAPALSEIFASDESEFAKLFSKYMVPNQMKDLGTTPPAGSAPAGTPPVAPEK